MKNQELYDYQEVIRLKNALVAAQSEEDKRRIQSELIEKIDNWFRLYRPHK